MKNKTIKAIACVIAGLTLTACVGSIDASGNTSTNPKIEQNTEPTLHILPRVSGNKSLLGRAGADYLLSCTGIRSVGCLIFYDNEEMLIPLTDNEGKATYSGTINYSFYSTVGRRQTNRSAEAEFKVNFTQKTITYNGTIQNGIGNPSTGSMDAKYNSKGQITGIVEIDNTAADISGVIGASKMLGYFANDDNHYAGGFTASRD